VDQSKFFSVILAASAALAGCSSTPIAQSIAKVGTAPTSAPTSAPGEVVKQSSTATPMLPGSDTSRPVASPNVATVSLPPHLDPKSQISTERSVYFDFDEYAISRADAMWLIEVHGKYLLSKPSLSITIEGNTDERGSAEYNLSLGQKRAQAVAQALKIFGVDERRMEAVSWGKERPKATGHDEEAWAENRRADLVYPKQ
jgi:peptidoglycan-associated lipoprotein